jgi:hypothetical protein
MQACTIQQIYVRMIAWQFIQSSGSSDAPSGQHHSQLTVTRLRLPNAILRCLGLSPSLKGATLCRFIPAVVASAREQSRQQLSLSNDTEAQSYSGCMADNVQSCLVDRLCLPGALLKCMCLSLKNYPEVLPYLSYRYGSALSGEHLQQL